MESAPAGQAAAAPRRARLHMAAPIIVLFAGLALLLAACGGNSSASSGGSASPSASSSASPTATGAVAFAQCMRSNGVSNFPDPQGGHFLISGSVQNNPSFHSAESKCQHLLGPNGATNGGSSSGNTSKLLAFAHCMQTHGVPKFPDPTANGAIGLPQGVNPNSAAFQKAWSECQSKLPGNLQGQQP